MCERDAEKLGVSPGDVKAFSDYLPAMWSVWSQRGRHGSSDRTASRMIDALKLIIWQLPYFSYHLRVVRLGLF